MGVNPDSSDGYWSPTEINDLVIEYTGKTSTLAVLKTFWKISMSYNVTKNYKGLVLDLDKGFMTTGAKSKSKKEIIVIGNIVKNVEKTGRGKNIKWVKTQDQYWIFDEVHLFLNQSLRTGMGMNLSHLARQFISFTGTPVIDNKTEN